MPLDYSLGSWGGDESFDLQPGKVLDRLTATLEETSTWKAGGEWAEVTLTRE